MGKWYQIFKAGEQTDSAGETKNWTIDDLNTMVTAYNEQNPEEKHTAPIILGHVESTTPAYGWIDKLKREGNTLLATFKDVATEFKEVVNAGRYKTVSASFYPDNLLLRHLAFLGANIPAVKGLEPVQFTQSDKEYIEFSNCFVFQQKESTSMDEFQKALLEYAKLTFSADVVSQIEEYINTYNAEKEKTPPETPPKPADTAAPADEKPQSNFSEADEVAKLRKQVTELQKKQRETEFSALMATKKVPEAMQNPLKEIAMALPSDFSENGNKAVLALLDSIPKFDLAEFAEKAPQKTDVFDEIRKQIEYVEGKK